MCTYMKKYTIEWLKQFVKHPFIFKKQTNYAESDYKFVIKNISAQREL
uniref:Uncharacterized protein n=1 Tax=Rhizophora mucronata TaxID=61149 RepID=A0A2P2Q1E7_RHIMU